MRPLLRPSPDTWPRNYTYELHQDYPDLLDSLWPRTLRQPCLCLSTAPTLNTAETTRTLCNNVFQQHRLSTPLRLQTLCNSRVYVFQQHRLSTPLRLHGQYATAVSMPFSSTDSQHRWDYTDSMQQPCLCLSTAPTLNTAETTRTLCNSRVYAFQQHRLSTPLRLHGHYATAAILHTRNVRFAKKIPGIFSLSFCLCHLCLVCCQSSHHLQSLRDRLIYRPSNKTLPPYASKGEFH